MNEPLGGFRRAESRARLPVIVVGAGLLAFTLGGVLASGGAARVAERVGDLEHPAGACGGGWVMTRVWQWVVVRGCHFWVWSLGVGAMFFDLMIAGLVHGFMQRDLNDWSDILRMSEPFWWVRTVTGVMVIAGLFCAIYNMVMTAKAGAAYQEDKHYIPAQAD